MNIVLDYWPRRWQSVCFNFASGKGHIRWFSRKPSHCAGWSLKHSGKWYAVWSSGDDLVFQVGSQKWPITDVYQCRNDIHGGNRIFTISQKNEVIFELRYKALDIRSDQIFDNLDLELQDFFYWISSVWNNPGLRGDLKRIWRKCDISA